MPLFGNLDSLKEHTMAQLVSAGFEQKFFRQLNRLVEPAVRKGFGSPRLLPGGLVVLESIGFKSGERRRTPLLSFGIGRYRVVSTVRGDRSFWVRNLLKQPKVNYFLGGRRRRAEAIVLVDGLPASGTTPASPVLRMLTALLSRRAKNGLVIAILVPEKPS